MLKVTPKAEGALQELEKSNPKKWKKVNKALRLLAEDPAYPSLNAHKWDTLKGRAPGGGDVWTAYVENHTPGAWRIFYYFDKQVKAQIWIIMIEPHS